MAVKRSVAGRIAGFIVEEGSNQDELVVDESSGVYEVERIVERKKRKAH